MRFMVIMFPGDKPEKGMLPPPEFFAEMTKFNEELLKAGVMLACDGLHPSSKGARVSFRDGKRTVTDGPFAEAKEVIGGYWLLDVKSKEEAVEWASRCPNTGDEMLEIRQVFEMEDFSPEIQAVAAGEVELRAQLEARGR
jgi:hypothetical protein